MALLKIKLNANIFFAIYENRMKNKDALCPKCCDIAALLLGTTIVCPASILTSTWIQHPSIL